MRIDASRDPQIEHASRAAGAYGVTNSDIASLTSGCARNGTLRTRLKAASGAFPDAWYRRQRVSFGGREERCIEDAVATSKPRVR